MVHKGEDVVIVGGSHSLHLHEKLAIAVSKAMRGHSLQETKKDGRFHVHTKTYLDGAILKEVHSTPMTQSLNISHFKYFSLQFTYIIIIQIVITGNGTIC